MRYTSTDTLYEDTILIRAVDLPAAKNDAATDATEETDATEASEDSESEDDEEEGIPTKLLVIGGIGVGLVVIVIAAIFIFRKKPQQNVEIPPVVMSQDIPGTDPVPEISFSNESDIFDQTCTIHADSVESADSMVTVPVEGRCHVSAVAIMHPEIQVDFYLTRNMETTFGRTEKADIILNDADKKLSSCHGCLFWNGEILLVQDRQSTNGTAVNGEVCPRDVWLRLENGSILTAGRYEYRITFKADA